MKYLSPLLFTLAGAAAPPIVEVYNAASQIPAAVQHVAQGSMFVLKLGGTGIGPPTRLDGAYPLPTTDGLAGLTLQAGAVGAPAVPCILVYAGFEEVGAILPSSVPLGEAQLMLFYTAADGKVTAGPNPRIRVVAASFGIFARNRQNLGPADASDAAGNPIDITNPAHNGDTISLRGTGLGKIGDDETVPPVAADLNSGAQVFVGNQPAAVVYGGRAGDAPGIDRIDFVVPDGLSGCFVSLLVKVGGAVSNSASIPLVAADQSACADPALGTSAADLQPNSSGGLKTGVVSLTALAGDAGDGKFSQFDSASAIGLLNLNVTPSVGSCNTFAFHGTDPGAVVTELPPGLDAGPQLNVSGPNGARPLPAVSKGSYAARLGGMGSGGRAPYLAAGTYTIDNGKGGSDVGPFSARITIPRPVAWTNPPLPLGNIPRSRDLAITWSGGGPNELVIIYGASISSTVPNGLVGEFLCAAPAGDGKFTVPADLMANLPPTVLPFTAPTALMAVGTFASARFTASGIDFGYVWGLLTSAQIVAFQ